MERRVEIILKAAAAEFRVSVERMTSRKRGTREVMARILAQAALSDYTNLSWNGIGQALGRLRAVPDRNHGWLPEKLKPIAAQLTGAGLSLDPGAPPPKPKLSLVGQFGIDAVLTLVCDYFRVGRHDLCSVRRTQAMVTARVGAVHALRTLTRLSTPHIGRILRRDHSTVIHHLMPEQAAKYPWLTTMLRDMEAQLRAPVLEWQQGVPVLEPRPETAISTAA